MMSTYYDEIKRLRHEANIESIEFLMGDDDNKGGKDNKNNSSGNRANATTTNLKNKKMIVFLPFQIIQI